MAEAANIYGHIRDLDQVREIYRKLLAEIELAETWEDLDAIKKRSEYLCTLADNPQWSDEAGRGGAAEAVSVCLENDGAVTDAANRRVDRLGLEGERFARWRRGEDSLAGGAPDA